MEPVQVAALVVVIVLCMALGGLITLLLLALVESACEASQQRKHAKVEQELDAQSEEMRQSILSLAESLAADRDEAAKAMTRAMFITTGRVE